MSVSSVGMHGIHLPRPSARMPGGPTRDIGDLLTTEGNVGGAGTGSAPGGRSPSLGADSMAVLLAAQSQDQPATDGPASPIGGTVHSDENGNTSFVPDKSSRGKIDPNAKDFPSNGIDAPEAASSAAGVSVAAQADGDPAADEPPPSSGGSAIGGGTGAPAHHVHHGHGGGRRGGPERIGRDSPMGLIDGPGLSAPDSPTDVADDGVGNGLPPANDGTSPHGLLGEFMLRASPLNSYSANWVEQQYSIAALLGEDNK